MAARTDHPIVVHRRREHDGVPIDDRKLRRAVEADRFVRIAPGSFVSAEQWRQLSALDRHYLRVLEAADRLRSEVVVSHFAAAAAWRIDVLGSWPETIDVRIERRSGGRSSGLLRRHALGLDGVEIVPWGRHWVTSPAQTVLDLAASTSFVRGVVAMDQALWRRRETGALTTMGDLTALADRLDTRGAARVRQAVEFATGESDSVRETQSRVVIDRLGFPAPLLQKRFVLPSGRVVFTDFFFEGFDHAAEFDGVGKYLDPLLLRGRTPEQALIEEKDRADELARVVARLSRWRTPALNDPRQLYDILGSVGLPASRPRPRYGLRWE